VAEMNDYQFKLAKIKNDFIWHSHEDTDETFIVIEGKIYIEFEDETVELSEGEMIVVPKGKKHRPYADEEAKIMLIEPKGVRNTGDIVNDLTSDDNQWI
jgi:mannose-6-phosphate isomerase-like protein (cupin superfamily)